MKKNLLFIFVLYISTNIFVSASTFTQQDYLTKNFTTSPTSNYDPMDIFGILTFFMQRSETTEKYNYEAAGLTWSTMAEAINGNPDSIFTKLNGAFTWEVDGNLWVLTEFNFYKTPFTGTFDGKYFKNLKSLTLIGCQITSLNLVNNLKLISLDCRSNKLTSLDVSKNSNLERLSCNDNQLTSLDVSKNTNLEYLYCNDNQLTSFDLTNNPLLKDINLDSNKIKSLDVSKNTNLESLSCYNNKLTSLNVSNNLLIKYLYCHFNNLTSIDVSNNTNLLKIFCSNNKLTSLDVSKNINLINLYCNNNYQLTSLDVSKNTNLVELYCNNNQLTSLDVSKNTNLVKLYCNNNQLTSLDVSENTNLVKLNVSNNQLKFSTLKGNFSKIDKPILLPQALLKGETRGYFELIDLTSEYDIDGTLTTFTWYDKATNKEVNVFTANGTFYASAANAGKTLLCKMTNALYPALTLEYEVTITQSLSAKYSNFSGIPKGFTLTGPEANPSNLEVYPNPVTHVLKITTPSKIESVIVYNYSGREVKRITSVPNKEVNLQDLASGNYMLTIKTNQGTITKKIIKK